MLIAGKDFPEVVEFAESIVLAGYGLAVAASPAENTALSSKDIAVLSWNKGSAISARSAVIQAETLVGNIDDFILYFDASTFAQRFKEFRADVSSEGIDAMLISYQYLTMEILNRIQQHQSPARIVFVLKSNPTEKEAVLSPSLKNSGIVLSNPIVASAEAGFANFAENIAAIAGDRENVSVLLITGDSQNETLKKDSSFVSWLTGYLDACDQQKHKPNAKSSVSWVKAGAKNPGGFSLFK